MEHISELIKKPNSLKKNVRNDRESLASGQKYFCFFQKSTDLFFQAGLDFVMWVSKNPCGVVALPLGPSAKLFVNALNLIKAQWRTISLNYSDLPLSFPDISALKFVQMYEYLDLPANRASVSMKQSIVEYYVSALGLLRENLLLLDADYISKSNEHDCVQYCIEFENKVALWGGVGFWCDVLSNAGTAGCIMRGPLSASGAGCFFLDYEHAALLAPLYGGISYSRNARAFTGGSRVLMMRGDAHVLLLALGAGLREHLKKAMNEGAAAYFINHQLCSTDQAYVYATESARPNEEDGDALADLAKKFRDLPVNKTIFHTAPHHDDIMLAYHSLVVDLLPHNTNIFAYLTSGSNAVTDAFLTKVIATFTNMTQQVSWQELSSYEELLVSFAQAYNGGNFEKAEYYGILIVINCFIRGFGVLSMSQLLTVLKKSALREDAFRFAKGLIRESEVDRMWSISRIPRDQIFHMRSQFYKTKNEPSFEDDVMPLIKHLSAYKPDIVTVAFDPAGSGPDTHFLVLGIVARALEYLHATSGYCPQVWGYRNVWFRFDIKEASYIVPVTGRQQQVMDGIFKLCFSSQRDAEYPSPFYDGPFSELSCKIQQEQLQELKSVLIKGGIALPHTTTGLIFLKAMSTPEFLEEWGRLVQNF